MGGRKRGGRGDLGQDQVKKETEVPGLSGGCGRLALKEIMCISGNMCVCECRYERVMCYVYKRYVYLEIYVCIYVHVVALKNMCV